MLQGSVATSQRKISQIVPTVWLDLQLSRRGRGHVLDWPDGRESTVSQRLSELITIVEAAGFDTIEIGSDSARVRAQIKIIP